MTGAAMARYTLDELRFIASRVVAEVRAHPPEGPLLVEPQPRMPKVACKYGHTDPRTGNGHCAPCERERMRRERARREGL